MKHNNKYLLLFFLAFVTGSNFAQDTRHTQAYSNPLMLNPAIMGANTDLRIILNYRSQWSNIDKGYTSYAFSGICPIYIKEGKEKLDIGLNVNNDKAGAFETMNAALSIGYNLHVSKVHNLSFALQGGFIQKSLDAGNLSFDEQYIMGSYNAANPKTEIVASQKLGYADVSFGAMWFYDQSKEDGAKINAYSGVSGYHLNQPNESYIEQAKAALPMRFVYMGGIKILGENKIDFTPNVRYNIQAGSTEMAAGLYMDYRFSENVKFVLGSWYRTHDAIAFAIGIEHKSFTFGYSYDIVTDLNAYVSGANANELSLSYKLNRALDKDKVKMSLFPTF